MEPYCFYIDIQRKRNEAESQYGLSCQRLEQLEADAMAHQKINAPSVIQPTRLTFNIDDALEFSYTRLKKKISHGSFGVARRIATKGQSIVQPGSIDSINK
jgi:hypothetical protein